MRLAASPEPGGAHGAVSPTGTGGASERYEPYGKACGERPSRPRIFG